MKNWNEVTRKIEAMEAPCGETLRGARNRTMRRLTVDQHSAVLGIVMNAIGYIESAPVRSFAQEHDRDAMIAGLKRCERILEKAEQLHAEAKAIAKAEAAS